MRSSRRSRSLLLLASSFCVLVAAPAWPAPTTPPGRDSLVVSTAWLAGHLSDPGLVLLHVGEKAEYDAHHIAGARFVSPGKDLAASGPEANGLTMEMLPAETLRQRLEALGVSDRSRVIVYFGKDWISPTTRVLFTLDAAGLEASLLDGGMEAWVRDGHPVTDAVPPAAAGHLSALALRPMVVDADYVHAHLHDAAVAIVDARDTAFYDGSQTGGGKEHPQRAGHIAGAHSVPFSSIVDDRWMLRPPAELAALFAKAGVKPEDTVVTYCHIGQQASATLFAARTLGYKVLLYDGSFEDWSRHADYPVENPAQASAKP